MIAERMAKIMVKALLKVPSRHSSGETEKNLGQDGPPRGSNPRTHCQAKVRDVKMSKIIILFWKY